MKKSTTLTALVPAANIEEAWQEVDASFERFCLTAGLATLSGMMEEDAVQLCGPRYGRKDGKAGHRCGNLAGVQSKTGAILRNVILSPSIMPFAPKPVG